MLFCKATRGRRRVIVVAYVGVDAPDLIPDFNDVELYCWPQVGATDPNALATLQSPEYGAKVFLSDGLHVKLYWVEGTGYVVTSANLSRSALGARSLHEAGVFVDSTEKIDIDALLGSLNARAITQSELRTLQREHDLFWFRNETRATGAPKGAQSFEQWYDGTRTRSWKLGWWDTPGDEAPSVAGYARAQYGVDAIEDYMDGAEGDYSPGDWVLTFRINADGTTANPSWLFVQDVRALDSTEFDSGTGYSHQAIQVTPLSRYTRPPFAVNTAAFRRAFRKACSSFGIARLENSSTTPPVRFLTILRNEIG
jgi:hypothetical protein